MTFGRRALGTIAEALLAGAPSGALVAEIALFPRSETVQAGLLSTAPAPKTANLGIDPLRRSQQDMAATYPAPEEVQSDDYWVTIRP